MTKLPQLCRTASVQECDIYCQKHSPLVSTMGLIPETSPNYSYALKSTKAANARYPNTVELERPTDHAEDYQLYISYRKYRAKRQFTPNTRKLNLVFFHGNGMNKGLWHYHVDKLYEKYPQLDVVCTFDQVNHCDLVWVNQGKLGSSYNWNDGAKDVAKVLTEDEGSTYLDPSSVNICVGHSMGGFQALMTTARETRLFDATFLINSVTYGSDFYKVGMEAMVSQWIDQEKVISLFATKNTDWLQELMTWMKEKSFFKRFHPTVLHNMIHDEYAGKYDPKLEYERIDIKTPADTHYICYLDSGDSIMESLPKYHAIQTKVYVLFTEHDLMTEEGKKDIESRLPNAIHVQVPNRFHLFNAEQPDELISYMSSWIDETYASASPRTIVDAATYKEFGPGFRNKRYDLIIAKVKAKF